MKNVWNNFQGKEDSKIKLKCTLLHEIFLFNRCRLNKTKHNKNSYNVMFKIHIKTRFPININHNSE